jgi:hypothetical protein
MPSAPMPTDRVSVVIRDPFLRARLRSVAATRRESVGRAICFLLAGCNAPTAHARRVSSPRKADFLAVGCNAPEVHR